MDEFARRSDRRHAARPGANPPASFYRTNRDPETAAEAVGQVFLGVRLQCARCHNHPFDVWTQDDYYGLAAYFANLDRKQIDNSRRDKFDKHEINGDVIIYLSGRPRMVQPRSGEMMRPKPPGGPAPELDGDPDALDDLADWLTARQPPVRPQHGQPRLVPPARPRRRRPRGRLPRLQPAVATPPCSTPSPPSSSRGGHAAPPAGRASIMKSETYQARLAPRTPPTPTTRPTSPTPPSSSCPPRSCSTPSARSSTAPTNSADAPAGAACRPASRRPHRRRVPPHLRQARSPLDLRMRAIRVHHARPGVPAHQRRVDPRQARRPTTTGSAACSPPGRPTPRSSTSSTSPPCAASPTDRRACRRPRPRRRSPDRRRAWEDVAWAILNSKEFLLRH